MGYQLTQRMIKLLCGAEHYERGMGYWENGQVTVRHWGGDHGEQERTYAATILANKKFDVSVVIDDNGDVKAECSCLSFYADHKYCKHVAAALLAIHQDAHGGNKAPAHSYSTSILTTYKEESEPLSSRLARQQTAAGGWQRNSAASDNRLVDSVFDVFRDKPARAGSEVLLEHRERLQLEATVQLGGGLSSSTIGIELKLGVKRLYQVQKIKDVLEHIDKASSYVFTKLFTYRPDEHYFHPRDYALLQGLIHICKQERDYKRTMQSSLYVDARPARNERLLLIPPYAWSQLIPLLQQAGAVRVEYISRTGRRGLLTRSSFYEGFQLVDGDLPLRFTFDCAEDGEGYRFHPQGLKQLTFLEPYGVAFSEGKWYRIDEQTARRLTDLKSLLEGAEKEDILIAPEQMERFLDRIVPQLTKLGGVHMSEQVSERVVYKPLQARMYLDRVRERLLAGLEFQYGDVIINPLEETAQQRGTDRILMRNGERERYILSLLENDSFGKTEGGYVIEGDDAEYEFLHHIVPRLEELMDIYATSAVKTRLVVDTPLPKISLTWDERTDWLEFKFTLDDIPQAEIKRIVQALQEKRRYYKLPNGSLMPLESKDFEALMRVMNEVGLHQPALFDDAVVRLPAIRALALAGLPDHGSQLKLGKSLRMLLDNIRHPDNMDFPVPEPLQPLLRDYQTFGYQWMRTLAHYRFGGILGDDMGLGKTIQSIAFLLAMLPDIRERGMPALIVAPASLMYNWRNELTRFAPDIRAVIADGIKEEREKTLRIAGDDGSDAAGSAIDTKYSVDVIITSYPLLRRDAEHYICRKYHTLILDEAQAIKNPTTAIAKVARELDADYRFGLTGTPIENRLEDLWSIYRVVFPGLFPDRKTFGDLTRETVARRIRPFLLRRLKSEVLKELPEKIETIQTSELLPEQRRLYAAYLAKLRHETLKHLDSDDFGRERIRILAGITRLRQICCHPSLFAEDYKGSSAKFEQLLELIEECAASGKRPLIFSQFTSMLEMIGRELGYRGISFFYLDGSTPAAQRVELCNRFNAGERDLFLLSLKAGGTGLNLTGADTVILYDLWWNPAVEQQAADRAHRIGQRSVVQVIRLVARGTVEDKMYQLQERKRSLIDEVIQPGQEALSSLTEQDIREILSLEE
ncbi:DEAD/DEAH box helicase [Paenibacillus chungangensis]|uniref:SNF2 helicase associated domain-containing protein n=1 Tax=Paenibacillus chungangensis TaxID=696535 RepID=A0ABW3HSJ0_9BACL